MRFLFARRVPLALLAPALVAEIGCGGDVEGEAPGWAGAIDTVGGVVIVNNPERGLWPPGGEWRVEEDLRIGVLEGDPNYQFARIGDLEVDRQGNIYVLEVEDRQVRVFDPAGKFVRAFGRQGEGPGEFENPADLFWKGDTLVVWDWRNQRMSYFDRDGTLHRDQARELPFGMRRFLSFRTGACWRSADRSRACRQSRIAMEWAGLSRSLPAKASRTLCCAGASGRRKRCGAKDS